MDYEEEIRYRKRIMSRAINGEKITAEERLWLVTHRVYNMTLGYPYLNTDIIHLHPKVNYSLRVKIEKRTYPGRMIPIIAVPGGKGKIVTNLRLTDIDGNVVSKKFVKMLALLLDLNRNEAELSYQSDLGLLEVSYQCDFFDDKQHLMIRMSSGAGTPNFAMLREVIADNKILYRCKAPINDDFESLVFSVEWKAASGK